MDHANIKGMSIQISSTYIREDTALGVHYPDLKKTNSVYETVTIGYTAIVERMHESWEFPSREEKEFKTYEKAEEWISKQK